ncbi:hypothetical protein AXG93_1487s1220 [Marchantia polymorpha subsp. ruderalis]|uniref:Reverse transcriptase Ty1/copia-type domain-containing protein n=1 Tax=Marchantia polymorpha subsp. ruderalis TaxID=1480154 RepID=A0A176WQK4_MARPO|nr:hypothetical protein AXG93_1487s1220 [Marchantia polymorpha subsp. ruderalis]
MSSTSEDYASTHLRCSYRAKYHVKRLMHEALLAVHHAYMVQVLQDFEPSTIDEALGQPEWVHAMGEELGALTAQQTWELVDLPEEKNAIGCKWVYKIKQNADETIARYKTRLIVKGFAQQYGLDYDETFSPVAKMATICTLVVMATSNQWLLHQMDVKNAFLNGGLQEEVYMVQPPGYESPQYPHRMAGSLIYLTLMRPHLSYSVGVVSQFMQAPQKPHLDAARRILRYVKFTIQFGLYYKAFDKIRLHGFTDADWAGSIQDCRSTSGYAFSLGSAAISWASKKQLTVALSSIEADYREATIVTCECVWLRVLLE